MPAGPPCCMLSEPCCIVNRKYSAARTPLRLFWSCVPANRKPRLVLVCQHRKNAVMRPPCCFVSPLPATSLQRAPAPNPRRVLQSRFLIYSLDHGSLHVCLRGLRHLRWRSLVVGHTLRRPSTSSSASSSRRTRAPCPPGCSRRSGRTGRGATRCTRTGGRSRTAQPGASPACASAGAP